MIGETFQSTWGLFGILMLAAIIAFATIFLFKNRILQIRMVIFNSLLLVGYYLAFLAFYFVLRSDDTSFQFIVLSIDSYYTELSCYACNWP